MTPQAENEDRDLLGDDEEVGDDSADAAAAPSLQDWIEAENSRPTLPDERADGLDDMDEEVRRQAEDAPPDTPGR